MALAPKFAAHKLVFGPPAVSRNGGVPAATNTLEIFLDYVCPFSAKLFNTIYTGVSPLIKANPVWASSVQVIFRQQVQPWHPSSTLTHESALAVLKIAPEKFWDYSAELFRTQRDYFDVNVVNESRNQTYARLAKLAGTVGVPEKEVLDLLTVGDQPTADGSYNSGNGVTNDLKVLVKLARLVSVHVSPTILYNGVVQGDISSGWTVDQWEEWLKKNI
jgi:protein-disulfide isomerase